MRYWEEPENGSATHRAIDGMITSGATLLVEAAQFHEDTVHDGEACPGNRLELLAYLAFRLSVPADAFEDEEARAIFQEQVLDRDACYAEHVIREDGEDD